MPQLRPTPIALTRLHKDCSKQQIPSPQPQMAPTRKHRTRSKARDSRDKGKVRGNRDKVRDKGKARDRDRSRVPVVAMAVEEKAIRLEASQGKTNRSLCQDRPVLVAARKAMMVTTALSRTAVLSPTRRSLNNITRWPTTPLTIATYHPK